MRCGHSIQRLCAALTGPRNSRIRCRKEGCLVSEDFAVAKEALDIVEVAKRYGVHVVRGNKAHCPFHCDRTPSMSFYDHNRKFHCFSCNTVGDVIDLVQRLLNASKLEALRELNSTYRLGLDLDTPPSPEKVRRAISLRRQRQQEQESFEQWERGAFLILSSYFRTLCQWKEEYAPRIPDEPLQPRFVVALHQMEYIEYLLDTVFINGTRETKIAFFKSHEGMLRSLEQKLKWEGVANAYRSGAGAFAAGEHRPVIIEGGLRPAAAA